VEAFIRQYGQAQKMTARQIEVSYDRKYIPDLQDAAFGVPDVVAAGVGYSE
jgi:hypothetical protein